MTDCIFCRIVEGGIPAKMVHQDDHTLAFDDVNPQAPVHTLSDSQTPCRGGSGLPAIRDPTSWLSS